MNLVFKNLNKYIHFWKLKVNDLSIVWAKLNVKDREDKNTHTNNKIYSGLVHCKQLHSFLSFTWKFFTIFTKNITKLFFRLIIHNPIGFYRIANQNLITSQKLQTQIPSFSSTETCNKNSNQKMQQKERTPQE